MQLLNIFSGKIAQALCWMLVHSLWMGFALTVVTGIIMLGTKRQSAALRYNLLSASLLIFTIAAITIFLIQATATEATLNVQVASSAAAAIIDTNNNIQVLNIVENKAGFTTSLINFFNSNANIIVIVWFLIIAFRCIQLVSGLQRIKQIRTTQLEPVGEHWNQRLASLSTALHIKVPVKFFQSGLAKIPMVAGHFKPVILFPIGLINSLPAGEVEAVLAHELAHIRRKDYLVNMLQNFVEILFFFNPAILWVSSLIKIERENCCDDIAIAQTSSKRDYINALVSFQEYNLNTPQYATALAGNKEHLLQRVKRMLYNNNKTLNSMEKTFLTVCLVVAASLTVFFTQARSNDTKSATQQTITDTVPSLPNRQFNPADFKEGSSTSYTEKVNGVSHTAYVFKRNGMLYEIYGDVTSFKIDGKEIPRAEWGKYKDLMAQLKKEYKANHETVTSETHTSSAFEAAQQETEQAEQQIATAIQEKSKAEQQSKEALELKEQAETSVTATQSAKITAQKQQMEADKVKQQAEQKAKSAQQEKLKAEQKAQQLKDEADNKARMADDKAAEADSRTSAADSKANNTTTTSRKSKREITRTVDDGGNVTKSSLSYTEGYNYAADGQPYKPYKPGKNSYIITGIQTDGAGVGKDVDIKVLTNNVIADLIDAKVIANSANLSYKVSNESLVVNGKVQPEALHQKLKEKYIQSPDWKLLYNWKD